MCSIWATHGMAEFSGSGLLAALLLFTALTLRDVYVGRTDPQKGHLPADSEHTKPAKASSYAGPVLRFQYW